jgi:hypothetical protein
MDELVKISMEVAVAYVNNFPGRPKPNHQKPYVAIIVAGN